MDVWNYEEVLKFTRLKVGECEVWHGSLKLFKCEVGKFENLEVYKYRSVDV